MGRLLSTYLNDHLAGSTAGLELARRASRNNEGTPLGQALSELAEEIAEDRRSLDTIMDRLGVREDHAKLALAWTAEKIGRFKLNGRLVGYSPLSRLEELEMLALGIEGKLLLWKALRRVNGSEGRLAGFDLEVLQKRATAQRRKVERLRLKAAEEALQ